MAEFKGSISNAIRNSRQKSFLWCDECNSVWYDDFSVALNPKCPEGCDRYLTKGMSARQAAFRLNVSEKVLWEKVASSRAQPVYTDIPIGGP